MASSALRQFIFFELPFEMRTKIYREIFFECTIHLNLRQNDLRTAIDRWRPPKDVIFLRTSSQIYEEALPVLASASTLRLKLVGDKVDFFPMNRIDVSFDLGRILTSPATCLFLRAALPLIQALHLHIRDGARYHKCLELKGLTSLKVIHIDEANTEDDDIFEAHPLVRLSKMDAFFFQDSSWEDKIPAAIKMSLQDLPLLENIVGACTGRCSIIQDLDFVILEMTNHHTASVQLRLDLVQHRVLTKVFILRTRGRGASKSKVSTFDSIDAILQRVYQLGEEDDRRLICHGHHNIPSCPRCQYDSNGKRRPRVY